MLIRRLAIVAACVIASLTLSASNLSGSSGTIEPATAPTTVRFDLDRPGRVSLGIYTSDGVKVRDLMAGESLAAGAHAVGFDGLDQDGRPLEAGDYRWRLIRHDGLKAEYVTSLGTSWETLHWPGQHGGPSMVAYRDGRVWVSGTPEGSPQTVNVAADGNEYHWASNVFFGWGHPTDASVDLSLDEPTHWVLYSHMQNHERSIWRENALTGERPRDRSRSDFRPDRPIRTIGRVDAHAPTREPLTAIYDEAAGFGWLEPEEADKLPTRLKLDLPEGANRVTLYITDDASLETNKERIGITVDGKWRKAVPAAEQPRVMQAVPVHVTGPETVITIYSPDGDGGWDLEGVRIEAEPSRIDAGRGRLAVLFTASGEVVWYDPATLEEVAAAEVGEGALDLSLTPDGGAVVVTGDRLVKVERGGGEPRVLAEGLVEATRVAVDRRSGQVFVAEHGDSHQVKLFSAGGELERTFGREGGRRTGRYVPTDFMDVADIDGTGDGGFIVVEAKSAPRRTARFDAEGEVVREWYGGQRFYTFGEPDPDDATRFWIMSQWGWVMEIEIDYEAGGWKPVATYRWHKNLDTSMISRFENASRYHILRRDADGDGETERYLWSSTLPGLLQRVDEEAGELRPFAVLASVPGDIVGPKMWKDPLPASELPPLYIGALAEKGIDVDETPVARQQWKYYSWADTNRDGEMQVDEIVLEKLENPRMQGPMKSAMSIDTDFNIYTSWRYAGVGRPAWVKFPVTHYTANGAPRWSWNAAEMPDNEQPFIETRDLRVGRDGVIYTANAGGGDDYGAGGVGGGGHGFGWPATLARGTGVSAYRPDGTLLWRSGYQASRWDARDSRMHFPVYIAGIANGVVGVSDYAIQPCEFFTDDGLYVGGLLDGRVDDGLPERAYTWWTTDRDRPSFERQGVFQYDMVIGGTMWEHDGDVYYAGAGWNNMPLHRVHGLDALERQSGKLQIGPNTDIQAARAEGDGLRAEIFGNAEFSGQPAHEWNAAQVWFDKADALPEAARIQGKQSIRLTGAIEGSFAEDYVLAIYGKGEVRLTVGGRELLNGPVEGKAYSEPIRLVPGEPVVIRIDYVPSGAMRLSLSWESHSQPIQHVPAGLLYSPAQVPPPMASVSLSTEDGEVDRGKAVRIVVERTGDRSKAFAVPLTVSGTADLGIDYEIEPSVATFAAGQRVSKHLLRATRPSEPQPRRSLKLWPQVDHAYLVEPAAGVEVVLRDPQTQGIKPAAIVEATGENAQALLDTSGLQRVGDRVVHGEARETMWFARVPGRELSQQHVTIDLGRVYDLTDIDVWNFNRPGHRHGGIKTLEVSGAVQRAGLDDEPLLLTLSPAPETGPCLAEHHPLNLRARYVRLRPLLGHGSGLGFGLSEVRLHGKPAAR